MVFEHSGDGFALAVELHSKVGGSDKISVRIRCRLLGRDFLAVRTTCSGCWDNISYGGVPFVTVAETV